MTRNEGVDLLILIIVALCFAGAVVIAAELIG